MHSVCGVDYQLHFQPPVLDLVRFPLRKRGSALLSPGLSFFLLPWLMKVARQGLSWFSCVCLTGLPPEQRARLGLLCPRTLHFSLLSRIHHEFVLYLCVVSGFVIFLVPALLDIRWPIRNSGRTGQNFYGTEQQIKKLVHKIWVCCPLPVTSALRRGCARRLLCLSLAWATLHVSGQPKLRNETL